MRRLPVYLLLDTSGSMTGEPIEAVKNGVQMMVHSLRQNPQAIETAFVSIMTDGVPTDDWQAGFQKLKAVKKGLIVGCAAGNNADDKVLKEIADQVVRLSNTDADSIGKFFQWVSASIATTSTKVEETGIDLTKKDQLPPPPSELVIVS